VINFVINVLNVMDVGTSEMLALFHYSLLRICVCSVGIINFSFEKETVYMF
jgi:hypothetical protein